MCLVALGLPTACFYTRLWITVLSDECHVVEWGLLSHTAEHLGKLGFYFPA